jgi:UDP-N-acetylmuramoyl-L-alanyl-D-glutamate--2,6-diaminopimelate ligase
LYGLAKKTLSYGLESDADITTKKFQLTFNGLAFTAQTPNGKLQVASPLVGRINVYNILAAIGAAQALGLSNEVIEAGIRNLQNVSGRFQRIDMGQPFFVVVDYAHTDDALRNLTALARDFVARAGSVDRLRGKVITVFGCGGDRDRAKRPLMGEAAGSGSDFVVLTSDNPRSEDPLAIMNDALVGLQKSGAKYSVEPDRNKAIGFALRQASPGDIVLLAGKGHEKVQVTRAGTIPFDDVQVAREHLRELGYDCESSARAGSAGNTA